MEDANAVVDDWPMCKNEGCTNKTRNRTGKNQRCNTCISRDYRRRPAAPCSVEGCDDPIHAARMCPRHYQRTQKYGSHEVNHRPNWGTGRKISEQGYVSVLLPGHSMANQAGYVAEHRYVMSEVLGRMLLPQENVHHINGDRADNRPENLELWNTSQPPGQRVEDKVAFALEILALYRPEALA